MIRTRLHSATLRRRLNTQLRPSLYTAVLAVIPSWWPGRIACMEISLATVLATALTGRRARWVLGARFLPDAAHAWAEVPGGAVGRDAGDAVDRPWMPGLAVL